MEYKISLRDKTKNIIDYAFVDEDNFNEINKYKWYRRTFEYQNITKFYVSSSNKINGKRISLHKFIMGLVPKGKVIDHINGNGLDNRKINLRIVSRSHNNQNRVKADNVSSKYRGVSICNKSNKWVAAYAGKYIGKFESQEEAAITYDKYVYCILGSEAIVNILKYEDFLKLNIDTSHFDKISTKTLPLNISKSYKKFIAIRKYKNIRYVSKQCKTVEEALIELVKINKQIDDVIAKEELDHENKIILRNESNIAIISILNNKGEKTDILVDDDKWCELTKYSWNINSVTKYVETKSNGKKIVMHQLVYGDYDKDEYIIDHINHVRHDNRSSNLRINTQSGNNHNKQKAKDKSSKYYGVYWSVKDKRWHVSINKDAINHYIGTFGNEHEAALAYNKKAIELYGENANLNIVPEFDIKPEEIIKRPTINNKQEFLNKMNNMIKTEIM